MEALLVAGDVTDRERERGRKTRQTCKSSVI